MPYSRPSSGILTHEAVQARYSQALEFARKGDAAAALTGFLWCFDDGMARVSTFRVARRGALLDFMAQLGEQYPEALTAMRARRDRAEKDMLGGAHESDSMADFVALNRSLNDISRTLVQYDQLPADNLLRREMAFLAFEQLTSAQRYGDAVRAKPYAQMESQFDMATRNRPLPAGTPNLEETRKLGRDFAVNMAANSIEVLAGAGDLASAQRMAQKLLAYDGSEQTKTILRTRLARAGHPELFNVPSGN